jgi:dephospho-CoA kinase
MNKFIAIVGMCGSGKSVLSDELVKKGYYFFRFGQITLDIVKEKGLEPTEQNEKQIRENVRKEHGMSAYAKLNLPKIEKFLEKGNVVGDGLYSWSEYKILKEKFKDQLIIISVQTPPKLRYQRISERISNETDTDLRNRSFPIEQAKSRDYSEIENIEKGGPIAMADYTITNEGTLEEFKEKIKKLINIL